MTEEAKKEIEEIVVPKDYRDPILEHPHQTVQGENVITCRLDLQDPVKKIGETVTCPKCGTQFKIVQGE